MGDNVDFLGSDASPIIEYTNRVVYPDDEQIAFIQLGKDLRITDQKRVGQTPQVRKREMSLSEIENLLELVWARANQKRYGSSSRIRCWPCLFFLCPDEQQGVKADNQQRNSKRQMCPLLAKDNIGKEKDNETCPCGITDGFIYLGIHRSGVVMLFAVKMYSNRCVPSEA